MTTPEPITTTPDLAPLERVLAEFGKRPSLTESVEFTHEELLEIGSKALQMTLVTRVDSTERRLWVSIRDKIVRSL